MEGGVRTGRTLAEARALLGPDTPHVERHDAVAEAAALYSLAVFAQRFAPTVAVDPPDGLLMDVTGCGPLFGGEDRLAHAVLEGVRRLRLRARVAVADTAGCAWAFARYGDAACVRIESGTEREALSALPVAALQIAPATADALEEVGLRTIGELFPLPRDEVWARFGAELLGRLDRATGHASDPWVAVREEAPLRVERAFEGPVRDFAVLRSATRRLFEDLCRALKAAGLAAMELFVRLRRAGGARIDEPVRVSRASIDARHWFALFEPRFERLPPGDGIDAIEVTASRTRRLRRVQTSWMAGEGAGSVGAMGAVGAAGEEDGVGDAAAEVGRLVDTLVQRCGAGGVVAFEPVESHWPERAFMPRAPFSRAARPASAATAEDAEVPASGDRPSLLFSPPEEARVVVDEHGRPRAVTWRGASRGVCLHEGPERLAVPWWDPVADSDARAPGDAVGCERDYFRVGTEEGRWLWLFRRDDRWFVHGEWA